MNSIDEKLLALLRENARASTSWLARTLGLSRSTVQGRIQRLEQGGVIKGYTVIYGDEYESQKISAHVLIKLDQKLTTRTIKALHAMPELKSLYAISGDYDLIAVVQGDSTESLSHILDRLVNLEGIERTNSSVILETKFAR